MQEAISTELSKLFHCQIAGASLSVYLIRAEFRLPFQAQGFSSKDFF